MKLRKAEQDFIKAQGVARLATAGSNGRLYNVPVCPVLVGETLYVASEKGARKVKNIESNAQATITFDVYRDSWNGLRGVMLQCNAQIMDEKSLKKIRRKLYAKYPKYETDAPLDPADSVIIELVPERKFSWGVE